MMIMSAVTGCLRAIVEHRDNTQSRSCGAESETTQPANRERSCPFHGGAVFAPECGEVTVDAMASSVLRCRNMRCLALPDLQCRLLDRTRIGEY
jgi:hypothetical protein